MKLNVKIMLLVKIELTWRYLLTMKRNIKIMLLMMLGSLLKFLLPEGDLGVFQRELGGGGDIRCQQGVKGV